MFFSKSNQSLKDQELIRKRKEALSHQDPDAEAAYLTKLKEQRIKNAEAKAIQDAHNLANQKPFYQKIIGAGTAILKDLSNIEPNPDALINFNDQPRKRRKHR